MPLYPARTEPAMLTKQMSPAEMALRVARFAKLEPLPIQRDQSIPQEALDVIYARKLLQVIGLDEGETPIASAAPIRGAAGMTMTIACCPPGQGPALHAHRRTFETFTVLQGTFDFRYGDHGEDGIVLGRFDTISIPPGVTRAFRNVGDEEGYLQVVITGGIHDMHDIDVSPEAEQRLKELAPDFLERQKAAGITFSAGLAGTDNAA